MTFGFDPPLSPLEKVIAVAAALGALLLGYTVGEMLWSGLL